MASAEAHTRLLADEELRIRLERRETVLFKELAPEWQQIERQVERLGFGDCYFVTQANGPRGGIVRVTPRQGWVQPDAG